MLIFATCIMSYCWLVEIPSGLEEFGIDSGKAGTGKSPDPGAYKLNMTQVLLLDVGMWIFFGISMGFRFSALEFPEGFCRKGGSECRILKGVAV